MTDQLESNLRRGLDQIGFQPGPPDLADQALAGARRVRRRRLPLAAAAAVALAGVSIPLLPHGGGGPAPNTVGVTPETASAPAPCQSMTLDPTTVGQTWCTGPGSVKVPPLVGVSQENAEAQLKGLNLETVSELVESDKPQGTVLETNPAANATISEGTKVTLRVSKGNLKLVPQVSGKNYTEGEARAVLTQAGFLNITTLHAQVTTAAQDGKVLAQDPAADTPRDPSTAKIQIVVGDLTPPASPTA